MCKDIHNIRLHGFSWFHDSYIATFKIHSMAVAYLKSPAISECENTALLDSEKSGEFTTEQ
jgi:hypothetical protein